ncbi:MAG: DUF5698 domain-containing protein [Alkalispirochaeta sp.]
MTFFLDIWETISGSVLLTAVFIFLARLMDVSLGTVRLIFSSRGYQKLAPLIGFFEILLWVVVIQQVMVNMSDWINAVAYAGGFAAGTYVGIGVEKALSLGDVLIRAIIPGSGGVLSGKLRDAGFAVTEINAGGRDGPVTLLFTLIPRRHFQSAKTVIESAGQSIVYSAEDVNLVAGAGRRWMLDQHRAHPIDKDV